MAEQRLGPYRLERLLGQGGMGQVWLARADPVGGRPGRTVALKVLPPELAADPAYRSRFEREADLASRLRDRHLVAIHAHGELDGRLFIEMEYIDGEDLSRILHRGALTPQRAVEIVGQTAAALDAAHRAGLVHRDVKPSNIVVRRDGTVFLIDFGIAHGAGSTALTASGLAVGTWAYMAPERFTGETDARADIYSLGCVLFESLAGIRPFGDTDPARQMHDHLTAAPPSVRALVPGVPDRLDAVVARALAKEPGDRFPTAGEFARAAAAALGLPAAAAGPPRERTEHPGVRHYGLDAAPGGTHRYESPAPPATRRYESSGLPATRHYESPAPPHPSTVGPDADPAVGPAGTRRYETPAASHGTRPYTGLAAAGAASGAAGSGHPPTRAYTRPAIGHTPDGAAPRATHAGVRPGATARPTPPASGPPARRTPPARPRRRKSRLRRLLVWSVVLLGIPLLLIGGCAVAVLQGVGSFTFFSNDDPPIAAAGTPVRDGSFEFVVQNVESEVPTIGLDRAQGTFVVVSFTVRNIAPDPKTYTPLGQELRDGAGTTFRPDVTATAQRATTAAAPRTLQPGESLGTHLVYEVPTGSVPASMTFRDFPFSLGTSVAVH